MENRLIAVRLSAQQLSDPRFDDPRALVRWMGAVQAQDYKAVRWAVGIRLRTASLRAVNRALERGALPFAQVIEDNAPSLALQQKAGLTLSGTRMFWLMRE